MSAATRVLKRVDGALAAAVAAIAAAALLVAVASSFWQVLGRFVLQSPAAWSEALTRLALIWMVLLGVSTALRRGALIAVDLARDATTGRARLAIEAATLASCLVLFATLFWYGINVAQRVRMQEMAGLEISMAWGYAAIPIGSLFAALGATVHFLALRQEVRS